MSEIKTNKISSLASNNDITIDPDGTGDTIIGSGNLGIGTTSPVALLTTVAADGVMADQYVAKFTNSEATAGQNYGVFVAGGSTSADESFSVRKFDNSATYFKVRGDGKVGIGNTSPAEALDVTGTVKASTGISSLGVYNNTTGTGANLVVDSGGGFARSTSSQRYKNTITDATHGLTELLALRPVTYKHNGNGDTVFGGLIAEEVHTAGLSEFVDYSQDADGNDQPEALHYANMVSLCIKAIQELEARIKALESE